ncbi:MAG: serine O-acetyltransferase [Maricaulaceae bacterium]|jgi:serine O-acetyltransferase
MTRPLDKSETAKAAATRSAWPQMRAEADAWAAQEPILASFLHAAVLNHDSLQSALTYVLGSRLSGSDMNAMQAREVCEEALAGDPSILQSVERDLHAVFERDAACQTLLQPFLYFKGFHALESYRVAHRLWTEGRHALAYHIQSRVSERFAVDIHPAARIGSGVMIDHACSVIIGETAVVGDDCSLLHEVTLGGTGVKGGDRHPKIGRGVLIGAGAKILGNITIGDEAKIAAGSVVLKPVPPKCTVAGVPAIPVGGPCAEPAKRMNQTLDEADAAEK